MNAQPRLGIVRQRLSYHFGAQVRAANANVDNIGHGLAAVAGPRAGADSFAKATHFGQHRIHLWHDVLAIDQNGAVAAIAQRNMQHGAILSRIDLVAFKHGGDFLLHLLGPRQLQQKVHCLLRNAILGIIEQNIRKAQRKAFKARWVIGKKIAHLHVLHFGLMGG